MQHARIAERADSQSNRVRACAQLTADEAQQMIEFAEKVLEHRKSKDETPGTKHWINYALNSHAREALPISGRSAKRWPFAGP
eukprot:COSAG05_NODE_10567_length_558_cov_1.130719_1_plen_82_part_10